jgi:hypothetical protein
MLLERDRRTVTKAMQGVAPDGQERGAPRWKMATIVDALEAHESPRDAGHGRIGQIADELERLHRKLDAARTLIKSLPDLDSKQPHSRAAMKLIDRLDALYNESNALLLEGDPTSLACYVTPGIVGTEFRELLAAIYGRDVEFDGARLFPESHAEAA